MTRAAAFFDLDKTVIAKSSTLAFGRPFFNGGLINRRAVLKTAYAQLVFSLAGADAQQMERLRAQLTAMVTGWDAATVHEIVRETLHDIVDPLIYAEAADLIEEHRAAGREIVIVSSSGEEMVGPIGEMLGVDRVVATRMVTVDGRYTGEIDFYAYGENKAAAMRRLADDGGYDLADCYAYSDSITDLPMLSAVGHPTVVNPDRGLRKAALEHGWPVLQFTRPVSMRSRFSVPPAPVVTGAAVGVGAAVVGLAWYARHRALRTALAAEPTGPVQRPLAAPRGLRLRFQLRRGARAPAVRWFILPSCSRSSSRGWASWPCSRAPCCSARPPAPLPGRAARGHAPPGSACSSRCPARGSPCSSPPARAPSPAGGSPRRPSGPAAVALVAIVGVTLHPH